MLFLLITIEMFIFVNTVQVVRNSSCPLVTTKELNWKDMDGTWYLSAVATDLLISGDCAMVEFDHQDTLDVSIKWIANHTASYYNGSVALLPDPNSNTTGDLLQVTYNDQKTEIYSFLAIDYEHYAVALACSNNSDGISSNYKLWKMSRSIHLKAIDDTKMDQAIAKYDLQETPFKTFNNTEDTCRINCGGHLDMSVLVTAFTVVITLYRGM